MPQPGPYPSLVLVGTLLMLVLSGCTSTAKSTSVQSVIPTPTEQAGVIAGVLVNEEILPITQAQVGLLGTNLTATTNDVGAFTLDNVPPGDQTLSFEAPGYAPKKVTLRVEPGAVTHTKVTLRAIASNKPYLLETYEFAAFSYYAYNITNPTTGESLAWESYQVGNIRDQFRFRFDRTWTNLFLELDWTPSTPLADQMSLRVALPVGKSGTPPTFPIRYTIDGPSPLPWIFTSDQYHVERRNDPALMPYPDSEMILGEVRPATSAGMPVGISFMQTVTVYGTASYNAPLPPDYSRANQGD